MSPVCYALNILQDLLHETAVSFDGGGGGERGGLSVFIYILVPAAY
jgi:hypothetical protein